MLNQNSFQEVSSIAGINWSRQRGDEAFSVSWVDFNGDGLKDLWRSGHGFSGGGPNAAYPDGKYPYLYINNGDGTFTNLFETDWRRGSGGDTHATTWVDFDNDGDPDVFVSLGGQEGEGSQPNYFFVNNSGTLSEQAGERNLDYPFGRGRSSLWFDYDDDGLLDVLLLEAYRDENRNGEFDTVDTETGTAQTRTAMFRQNADGTFTDVTDAVGLDANGGSRYAQLNDVNGDRALDVVIQGTYEYPLKVYDISSGTAFNDITATVPQITSSVLPKNPNNDSSEFNDAARDSVIADFNNDGYNDIYLARSYVFPQSSSVYQDSSNILGADLLIGSNDGGEVGFDFSTTGNVSFDLLDYFSTQLSLKEFPNSSEEEFLIFIGEEARKPTATELTAITDISSENSVAAQIVNSQEAGFALSPSNVSGLSSDRSEKGLYIGYDAAASIWQVRLSSPEKLRDLPVRLAVESTENIPPSSIERVGFAPVDADVNALPDIFYLYDPVTEEFVNATLGAGLSDPTLSQSVVSGDFDNDMDLDLYLANSYSSFGTPNILYDNQGDGTFVPVELAGGAAGSAVGPVFLDFEIGSRLSVSDYDNDGFLDIFAGSTTTKSPRKTYLGTPPQLFQNQGNDNNWLHIDLQGIISNRDGIGARVEVTAGGITQLREQNNGSHVFAQNDTRLHFGLADNTNIDLIEVQWSSGITQTLKNVGVNQILEIVEPFTSNMAGTELADSLPGTGQADSIDSLAGDDTINGFGNSDRLIGGSGNDSLLGSEGDDTLEGGTGDDYLGGGDGRDILKGGENNDLLFGAKGNDDLDGGDGNDTLNGSGGRDTLKGADGDDVLIGDDGLDLLEGGVGDDTLRGGVGDDTLRGGVGSDRVIETGDLNYTVTDTNLIGKGNDVISEIESMQIAGGGKGNVIDASAVTEFNLVIEALGGQDTVFGGAQNDNIFGGIGADSLSGGAGKDLFVYLAFNHRGDTITDFVSGEDRIFLSTSAFNDLFTLGTLDSEQLAIGESATDSNDYLIYNPNNGVLSFDRDGDGTEEAVEILTLENTPELDYRDIWIIA